MLLIIFLLNNLWFLQMSRKAYIRYAMLKSFRSALKLHGSIFGGHELCVTEWPEFPWYKEEGSETIGKADAGLAGQHTAEASSRTQEFLPVTARNTSTPLNLFQSSCEVPVVQKHPNWHTTPNCQGQFAEPSLTC
jgi:hypothetical protein